MLRSQLPLLGAAILAGCATGTPARSDGGPDGSEPPADAGPGDSATTLPCQDVAFSYADRTAGSVWISGTFLGWASTPAEGALVMERGSDGVWTLTVALPPGRQLYKMIVDRETWVEDPTNPVRVPDGYGGFNSVIDVCSELPMTCDGFDWRDTVMYFAMVDRFFDSDGASDPVPGATDGDARTGPSGQYEGGDLPGVEQKVPYLADLGVTALWLSAPYEARNSAGAAIDPGTDGRSYSAYHGYWPSPADVDYTDPSSPSPRPRVESRIGTEDDLRNLVQSAHAVTSANGAGIKVLFDYVMNHVDIESGLYAAHYDWFARRDGSFALCGPEDLWDDPYWGTRCAFTDYLPPFDFDNPAARAWSVADAVWWATALGIDGYRLDAIKHVPLRWLTDLRTALGSAVADPAGGRFYMVGETFTYDDRGLIAGFVDPATMLDGQFDFPFKARLCEAVFTDAGRLDTFADWAAGNDGFYGPGALMTSWIGNHDVPRAIHFASHQIGNCREGSHVGNSWTPESYSQPTDQAPYERLGVAFAIMMTNPGIPLIYYGDEVGLAGGGDPDNRRMMPWDDAVLNDHQRALRDRVRALGRIRAEHRAIGRGYRESLAADQDTWVYRMVGCDEVVVVAINRADGDRTVTIPDGAWVDLITDAAVAGGARTLGPRSFVVLGAAP